LHLVLLGNAAFRRVMSGQIFDVVNDLSAILTRSISASADAPPANFFSAATARHPRDFKCRAISDGADFVIAPQMSHMTSCFFGVVAELSFPSDDRFFSVAGPLFFGVVLPLAGVAAELFIPGFGFAFSTEAVCPFFEAGPFLSLAADAGDLPDLAGDGWPFLPDILISFAAFLRLFWRSLSSELRTSSSTMSRWLSLM